MERKQQVPQQRDVAAAVAAAVAFAASGVVVNTSYVSDDEFGQQYQCTGSSFDAGNNTSLLTLVVVVTSTTEPVCNHDLTFRWTRLPQNRCCYMNGKPSVIILSHGRTTMIPVSGPAIQRLP